MIALLALLALQEPLPDGGEVRRRAERILAAPEYSTEGAPASDTGILEAILRWIQKRIASLARLGQDAPFLFWLVLIGCLVVLGGIFLHAGIVLSRALREARAGADEPALAGPGAEDPAAILARAREAARRGQAAEAARLSHRASVAGLGLRGLLRLEDTLTTGDCRRQLSGSPRDREVFDALVRIYEPAWFGKAPVEPADVEDCLSLAARLVRGGAP
jgi:hypothetical protein